MRELLFKLKETTGSIINTVKLVANSTQVYVQYTGLNDRKNNKIFEGDTVTIHDGYEIDRGVVVFDKGSFCVSTDNMLIFLEGLEVELVEPLNVTE